MGSENGRESVNSKNSSTAPDESWFTLGLDGDSTFTSSERPSWPEEKGVFHPSSSNLALGDDKFELAGTTDEDAESGNPTEEQLDGELTKYNNLMDYIEEEERRRQNLRNPEVDNPGVLNDFMKHIKTEASRAAAAQRESIITELNMATKSITLSTLANAVTKAEYLAALSNSEEDDPVAAKKHEWSKFDDALTEAKERLAKLVDDIEKSGHAATARIILNGIYKKTKDKMGNNVIPNLDTVTPSSAPQPTPIPTPKAHESNSTLIQGNQVSNKAKSLTMADAIRIGFAEEVGDEGVGYMVAEEKFDKSALGNIGQWWAALPEPVKNKIIIYEKGVKGSRLGRPLRDWLGTNGYPEFGRGQLATPTTIAA